MTANKDSVNLTQRETETLAATWQCFETEPKVDYQKLARITGYTEGSARFTLGVIKKKLRAINGDTPAATPKKSDKATGINTPKSTSKRNAKQAFDDNESPTKKRRGRPAKTPMASNADNNEDEDVKMKMETFDNEGFDNFDQYLDEVDGSMYDGI